MKNYLFILCFIFTLGIKGYSQGIVFEESSYWKPASTKAYLERKLIFVDFYTSWCGPCKKTANEVFPLESVGNVFNEHFVNLKIDIETEEGKQLAKLFSVTGIPTFYILDALGNIINAFKGGQTEESLLKEVEEVRIAAGGWDKLHTDLTDGKLEPEVFLKMYNNAQGPKKELLWYSYLKALSPNITYREKTQELISQIHLYDSVLFSHLVGVCEVLKQINPNESVPGTLELAKRTNYFLNEATQDGRRRFYIRKQPTVEELIELKERFNALPYIPYYGSETDYTNKFYMSTELFRLNEYMKKNKITEFANLLNKYMEQLIAEEKLTPEEFEHAVREHYKYDEVLTTDAMSEYILQWLTYNLQIETPNSGRSNIIKWLAFVQRQEPKDPNIILRLADLLSTINCHKEALITVKTALKNQKRATPQNNETILLLENKIRTMKKHS